MNALEIAKQLLKNLQDKPEGVQEITKGANAQPAQPAKKGFEKSMLDEDFGETFAKRKKIGKSDPIADAKAKNPVMKDDKPHAPNSPQDKAHDVVEQGQALKPAMAQASGGSPGRAKLLQHLRSLKDSSKLRSPANQAVGKCSYHKDMLKEEMSFEKSGEKGVHTPFSTSPKGTQDRSQFGAATRGHWSHGSPEQNKAKAVKEHNKVMGEMKQIKPNLPKKEK